jgi:SAM-dependent methyltransferase
VSTDEFREALRAMWGSVAGSWGEHAAFVDERGAAVTARMLELAAPGPGDRVLELACGPGGAGLAAAGRVEPGGNVVMSDVAAEMTAIAAARARDLGLDNVSTRELDLESIDEPDDSYDVVLCREGLMLVPEPHRAAAEIARVLAPDGRVAIAVWGPRERNPWLGHLFDAVSEQVGAPIPPPGRPGPFSLSDADALAALLSGSGLAGVTVTEESVPMPAASFEEWWSVVPALAGPLGNVLAALPEDAREAIRASAESSLRAYETPAGLEIPGVSLLASGRAG